MSNSTSRLYLRGAKEIARAVGIGEDDISTAVLSDGLPAFRRNGRGPWLMLKKDVEPYLERVRDMEIEQRR